VDYDFHRFIAALPFPRLRVLSRAPPRAIDDADFQALPARHDGVAIPHAAAMCLFALKITQRHAADFDLRDFAQRSAAVMTPPPTLMAFRQLPP